MKIKDFVIVLYFFGNTCEQNFFFTLTKKYAYDKISKRNFTKEGENMKFIHIADLHFDSPFSTLKGDEYLIEKRRLEQRANFKKIIDYIKKENINYLFIAGDLYENEYVKNSTIEYINNLFKEIPTTKVFITPGNHDPNIKGSIYNTFEFANNVIVFRNSYIEKYEDENIEIFGAGFNDFYMNNNPLENFNFEKKNKFQVLLMHADLNGNKDYNGLSYNPISESEIKALNFDYVALGHIHKNNFNKESKIIYPGSLSSLGFDEQGVHGMVVGEFRNKYLQLNFEKVDETEFLELEVDITNMYSQGDIVDYLNTLYLDKNKFVKIILIGKRKFLINVKDIINYIDNYNILRIKDETNLAYDLNELAQENTLKGIFVRKLLEKKEEGFYTTEEIEKAIEIGLEAME